jgi:hypothetical protein
LREEEIDKRKREREKRIKKKTRMCYEIEVHYNEIDENTLF